MTGGRGRSCKPLLDDLSERYWNLKEEALDRTVWGSRFGSDWRGPVVRRNTNCGLEPSLLCAIVGAWVSGLR